MGLDFRGSEAHWSYSGFNHFRRRVWAAAGHNPEDMEKLFDKQVLPPRSALEDGIWPLINHSDCDGDLTVEEMRLVEPRLRQIVLLWPEDDYDRVQGLRLADGMLECIEAGEALEFR